MDIKVTSQDPRDSEVAEILKDALSNPRRVRGQSLTFKNGYSLRQTNQSPTNERDDEDSLLEALSALSKPAPAECSKRPAAARPQGVGGVNEAKTPQQGDRGAMSDKVVLRFYAQLREEGDCPADTVIRRCVVFYYVEDDTCAVVENPVPNSGIPQGVLIKRQRIPKSSTAFHEVDDFQIGSTVVLYEKHFRLVGCDKFTRSYCDSLGIELADNMVNAVEFLSTAREQPKETRRRASDSTTATLKPNENLRQFLDSDRKVLRYYCVWDDTGSMFGEVRRFVLHYYLVDDTIEVREEIKPNMGRDPSPMLLRRQLLPKDASKLQRGCAFIGHNESEVHTWRDLRPGVELDVLHRKFVVISCDGYTKSFLQSQGLPAEQLRDIEPPVAEEHVKLQARVDAHKKRAAENAESQSKEKPAPPKEEDDRVQLRFVARINSRFPEDEGRTFVITYYVRDGHISIFEPPRRNTGIIGGKFLEKRAIRKPKSEEFYGPKDLYLGAIIEANRHSFEITKADDFTMSWLSEHKVG